ncbi:MAG: hypothetical protein IJ544_04945 [Prevotella sp.]|nr:hypothetical protein [Prevotella sp.]
MTLRIFNPEHDIALAANLSNFTAPHAGRQLRHDLGFLSALWAQEGDIVLTDDVELAERSFLRLAHSAEKHLGVSLLRPNLRFAPSKPGVCSVQTQGVDPWGWDRALKARLHRVGVSDSVMPSDEQIDTIRQLSHRRTSARLLPFLRCKGTVGEAFEFTTSDEVECLLKKHAHLVLKAPWSSSGRGLRFIHETMEGNPHVQGWLHNMLDAQGSVMAEPYYNKVKDFGMEFEALADGSVRYLGLSLFHTANGAYAGNILATESAKREMISRYVPDGLLDEVQTEICRQLASVFKDQYAGPFGIDMMIVRSGETAREDFLLHPCVEINLRRTMGHVALALTPQDDEVKRVMRIEYADNNYKLKIQRL